MIKVKQASEPNTYNVPKELWKEFGSDKARAVYNYVMSANDYQKKLLHPDTKPLPAEEWRTIVHNLACHAAWAVEKIKEGNDVIIEQPDIIVRGEVLASIMKESERRMPRKYS